MKGKEHFGVDTGRCRFENPSDQRLHHGEKDCAERQWKDNKRYQLKHYFLHKIGFKVARNNSDFIQNIKSFFMYLRNDKTLFFQPYPLCQYKNLPAHCIGIDRLISILQVVPEELAPKRAPS